MDQERWGTINRIFHAALEVDFSQRRALVAAQSNGDPDLQAEVEHLLEADAKAGSYLEHPSIAQEIVASSQSPLAPGDLLCGRFRIIREIAEGGMGHVFEAFDSELAVRVALKTIRAEIARNPEVIARFRQEVRLARSITHPNICRTFDLERETRVSNGQLQEIIFLTMEFLPGETLADRIERSGPVPLCETLDLARQIAAALHAAHALGIVHRDMKPANIMLVTKESSQEKGQRAVVTDFGLARLDPLALRKALPSLTGLGNPVGTLAYMAPEQLNGAAVSPATDVYAFGLILFEMITGQRVFTSANLLGDIAKRLQGPPPLERSLGAEVPASWHFALKSCLHVQPSDRPKDINDVIEMLGQGHGGAWGRLRWSKQTSGRYAHKASLIVGVSLLAMALILSVLRIYQTRATSTVIPGAVVYLTTVKNQTSVKYLDNVTELVRAGLSQLTQINLLDQGGIGDILQHMTKSPDSVIDAATAREIAMRAGAVRVIFVTATGANGNYSLDIDIQQPDNSPVRYRDHWKKRFSWQVAGDAGNVNTIPNELLMQVRAASNWIRQKVGESTNDIARLDTPPEDVTTNSWDALSEYVRAVRLNHEQKPADAVVALRNAIRLDSQFALAYGVLADIELTLHHEKEGFEAYKKALDPDLERRLSRRERDRLKGMYAVDSWDFPAAVDIFRDYQTFYPNDVLGWIYPTYPLRIMGRNEEAVANLKRAMALDPNNPYSVNSLVDVYAAMGDLSDAEVVLTVARQRYPTPGTTARSGIVAFLLGRYEEAEKDFSSLTGSAESRLRSRGFEMLADLAAERGRYTKALHFLDDGMKEDAAQGNPSAQSAKLAARGAIKAKLGDYNGCSDDLRVAVSLNSSPQLILTVETILGQAIQRSPVESSRGLRRQMIELDHSLPVDDYGVITKVLTLRSHAEAHLAANNVTRALQEFREAAAIDAPAGPHEYLGRALNTAATRETHTERIRLMRREALEIYATIARRPGIVWVDSSRIHQDLLLTLSSRTLRSRGY